MNTCNSVMSSQELELLVEGLAFNKAMEEDDGSRMSIDDFLAGKDFEY